MPVPPLTVPAFIGPDGGSGLLSELGQAAGPAAPVVFGAGLVGLGAAAVVIPLLAAPAGGALAVGGVVGGSILAVGSFLEIVQQLRDWGLLNYRPKEQPGVLSAGAEFTAYQGGNGPFSLWFQNRVTQSEAINCQTGAVSPGQTNTSAVQAVSVFGSKARLKATTVTNSTKCSGPAVAGTEAVLIVVVSAAGVESPVYTNFTGGENGPSSAISTTTQTIVGFGQQVGFGNYVPVPVPSTPGEFAPGTRPQLFPQTLPDAPALPAPAPATPLETPVLPPPPNRRPLAPPVTIPRPGQDPARVPVPGPSPTPRPGPGPGPVPSQPAPTAVPGRGPLPAPAPLPVPTTPGSVVVVDGQPISGPGQAPAPNLVAIAQELGRLERKNEILMGRPENGGPGELAEDAILAVLRRLLEQLVNELLNDVPAGSFTLTHACPPTGGGDPLPPVEVPYSGGSNPTAGILAKLDGLAGLIQAHKNMGQPTCRTPRVGQEVTVQFESDG